jgi:hypothetical protein
MPKGYDSRYDPRRQVHRGRFDPQNAPDLPDEDEEPSDWEPDYEGIMERRHEARGERTQEYWDRKY